MSATTTANPLSLHDTLIYTINTVAGDIGIFYGKGKLTVMGLVQALRRSIKGEKDKQNTASIAHKSALAIVPPKKVRSHPSSNSGTSCPA